MGRLTKKIDNRYMPKGDIKLGAYGQCVQKLGKYEDLEEAGRLIEQKHGEWILKHVGAGHYWECSVCHTNPCIYVTNNTNYCPNCGAKMGVE